MTTIQFHTSKAQVWFNETAVSQFLRVVLGFEGHLNVHISHMYLHIKDVDLWFVSEQVEQLIIHLFEPFLSVCGSLLVYRFVDGIETESNSGSAQRFEFSSNLPHSGPPSPSPGKLFTCLSVSNRSIYPSIHHILGKNTHKKSLALLRLFHYMSVCVCVVSQEQVETRQSISKLSEEVSAWNKH